MKYALSIAGHDPCGGAGITADMKVMNALGVQGLSACTAITYQTEDQFEGLNWVPLGQIKRQVEVLLSQYRIQVLKIGLVESWEVLGALLRWIRQDWPELIVIWDPILRASAGFDFHTKEAGYVPKSLANAVDLITPNWEEMEQLVPGKPAEEAARQWSSHSAVLLKGGHHPDQPGLDQLFVGESVEVLKRSTHVSVWPKHGSGCVLSAALAAKKALAPEVSWRQICEEAKGYTERYLGSAEGLLGFHELSPSRRSEL